MPHLFKGNNTNCPICYVNIAEDDNLSLPSQRSNKDFYDKYLNYVQCQ